MTAPRTPSVDEYGVVDPLRLPPVLGRIAPVARRLPPLGWVFVALGIANLALELVRSPALDLLDLAYQVGFALVVMLPAAVLWRQPDVLASSFRLLLGAILVALGEFVPVLIRSIEAWLPADPDAQFTNGIDPVHLALGILFVALPAFGWLYIGTGIDEIRERGAAGPLRMLSAVVAVAICVAVAVSLAALALAIAPSSDALPDLPGTLLYGFGVAAALVWAYLARVLIPRAGQRPRVATTTAGAAVIFVAVVYLLWAVMSAAVGISRDEGLFGLQSVVLLVGGLAMLATRIALFAAFALGLGDPGAEPAPPEPA
jgi:hypothetical protein